MTWLEWNYPGLASLINDGQCIIYANNLDVTLSAISKASDLHKFGKGLSMIFQVSPLGITGKMIGGLGLPPWFSFNLHRVFKSHVPQYRISNLLLLLDQTLSDQLSKLQCNFLLSSLCRTFKTWSYQLISLYPITGTWADRRTAAISLIELSERLDKQNLMYCDVKGENFGWLEDGRAVLLDSDTLFSRQELGQTMLVWIWHLAS